MHLVTVVSFYEGTMPTKNCEVKRKTTEPPAGRSEVTQRNKRTVYMSPTRCERAPQQHLTWSPSKVQVVMQSPDVDKRTVASQREEPIKREEEDKQGVMLSMLCEIREEQHRARSERSHMMAKLEKMCRLLEARSTSQNFTSGNLDTVKAIDVETSVDFRKPDVECEAIPGSAKLVSQPTSEEAGPSDNSVSAQCLPYFVYKEDSNSDVEDQADLYAAMYADEKSNSQYVESEEGDEVRTPSQITYGTKREPTDQQVHTMFENSKNAKLFALKLLGCYFTKREMAMSNLYGGKVFTGKLWAEKRALDPERMRKLFAYLEQYYPGCRDWKKGEVEIRDAINNKCRNSLRWVRENPLLDD